MDRERWEEIERLFHQASEQSADGREAWVRANAGGDHELADRVLRLLRADGRSDTGVERGILREATNVVHRDEDSYRDQRLGAWRILRPLGEGGMGTVFLVQRDDGRYEQAAALKLLRFDLRSREAQERFHRERRILARLEHPHIARLLDAGEHTFLDGLDVPYFVMEHVDGQPITEYAAEQSLSLRERIRLFQQALEAVEYAHLRFVLHRDLKPGNILVAPGGEVKLLDFGIAQLLDDPAQPSIDSTRGSIMTPGYASPEQILGEPQTIPSDVYGLGAVLFELLSGRPPFPFSDDDPWRIFATLASREAPPLGLDPDLDLIVATAMHREPGRRYASVTQMSDDLTRYLEGRPIVARPPSAGYVARKFLVRHRWPVAAALVLIASLAGGVATTATAARRANRHLAQLRQLSGQLLFQMHDAIEALPGATRARELLVTNSTQYLDAMASSDDLRGADLADLASAYERLGRLQGGPNAGHMGKTADAIQSYTKAIAVYDRVLSSEGDDREMLKRLAGAWRNKGRIETLRGDWDAAAASLDRAYEIGRRAAAPGELLPTGLADILMYQGDLKMEFREPDAALELYRKALPEVERVALPSTDLAQQRSLTNARVRFGQAYQFIGDLDNARAEYARALDRAKALLAANPDNANCRRDVYVMTDRLATVLGSPEHPNLGDARASVKLYRESQPMVELTARLDPQNLRAQRELTELHAAVAAAQREFDPAAAVQEYRTAFAMYAKLPPSAYAAPGLKRWFYVHHRGYGIALTRIGQHAEAESQLRAALAGFRELEFELDQGLTLAALARVSQARRDLVEARKLAAEAITKIEPTFKASPADISALRDLSGVYLLMGELHGCPNDWPSRAAALWKTVQSGHAKAYATRELERAERAACK